MIRVCKVYPCYYISLQQILMHYLVEIVINQVSYLRYLQNFQCIEIESDGIDNGDNSTLALEPYASICRKC